MIRKRGKRGRQDGRWSTFREELGERLRWVSPGFVWQRLAGWYRRGVGRRASWFWESIGQSVSAFFRFVWFVAAATGRAFAESWRSATWRSIWLGSPFVAVSLASFVLLLAARNNARRGLAHEYQDAGRRAMSRSDFAAADLYFERVLDLRGGSDLDAMFQIALAARELGNESRVESILNVLAPVETPRYAPAHLWRAERLLAKGNKLSPEKILDAHTHLRYVVQLEPNNVTAHRMLGSFYFNRKQWELAVEHLTIAAKRDAELNLPLARTHTLLGNRDLARYYGTRAIEYFSAVGKSRPRDVAARIRWADSLVFLEKFSAAVDVLRDGLSLQQDVLLKKALSRVYVVWSDSIRDDSPEAALKKLGLLEAAMSAFPHEGVLFDRMMRLLERSDSASSSAKQFLIERIARGDAPRLCHLLLGTYEGQQGNFEAAIRHLEQAHQLDEAAPIVANNLAWFMLESGKIDLERAHRLVSDLAARWPMMAAIHETRGQILARMGKWKEALAEFEKALPHVRGNAGTHRTLAKVYRELGMPELADEHDKLAREFGNPGPER